MKRKRKAKEDALKQTAVMLSPDMIERLQKAGGERGMGAEIRRRLEASFNEEWDDPKTTELLDAIARLDTAVRTYYGPWSRDRFAFDVLKEAIDRILVQRFQPSGEPIAKPTDLAKMFFKEDHLKDKELMGRHIAAMQLASNPKREA